MMRFVSAISLLSMLFAFQGSYAAEFRAAFVNMSRIEQDSIAVSSVLKSLKTEEENNRKMIERQQGIAREKVEALRKVSSTLSQSALQAKQETLQKELAAVDQKVRIASEKLREKAKAAVQSANTVVAEIAADVAKDKNYDAVFSEQVALFYSSEHDITDDVLKRMNKKHKTISY